MSGLSVVTSRLVSLRLTLLALSALALTSCGHGPLVRIEPPVAVQAAGTGHGHDQHEAVEADAVEAPAVALRLPDLMPRPTADDPAAPNVLADGSRDSEPIALGKRRAVETRIEPGVMPLREARHAFVASGAKGTSSIGTVTGGRVARSAEVPVQGPHHQILAKVAPRHTRFTTDEMRDLLLCAAGKVAADQPGQKLHLGNLSRMGGGPLVWSVSHQNGRDADLAFYTRDLAGKIAFADHLYHFGRNLQSTDGPQPLVFDVAANWSLVKGLLTCEGPPIQHLFIADWLKRPLLDHANKIKEDKALIARAAAILHQPRNAQPHHDHLHLRIGCSQDDRSEGCLQVARAPAEAIGQSAAVQARLPAVRALLHATDGERRMDAIALLVLYRDAASLPSLRRLLTDPVARVRTFAAKELLGWAPEGLAQDLDVALAAETDAAAAAQQLAGLMQLGATDRVVARLQDRRTLQPAAGQMDVPAVAIRGLAAALLSEQQTLDAAQTVLPLLADSDPLVRHLARQTIQRITNLGTAELLAEHMPGLAIAGLEPELPADQEYALWQKWFAGLPAGIDRDTLALRHLQAKLGTPLAAWQLDRGGLPGLVQALALPAPYRDNASRWIAKVVRYWPAAGRGARSQPLAFWGQWLVSRRLVGSQLVASVSRRVAMSGGQSHGAAAGNPAGSAETTGRPIPADDND
jgi:penicillin-insensitive murein endopeptidase